MTFVTSNITFETYPSSVIVRDNIIYATSIVKTIQITRNALDASPQWYDMTKEYNDKKSFYFPIDAPVGRDISIKYIFPTINNLDDINIKSIGIGIN